MKKIHSLITLAVAMAPGCIWGQETGLVKERPLGKYLLTGFTCSEGAMSDGTISDVSEDYAQMNKRIRAGVQYHYIFTEDKLVSEDWYLNDLIKNIEIDDGTLVGKLLTPECKVLITHKLQYGLHGQVTLRAEKMECNAACADEDCHLLQAIVAGWASFMSELGAKLGEKIAVSATEEELLKKVEGTRSLMIIENQDKEEQNHRYAVGGNALQFSDKEAVCLDEKEQKVGQLLGNFVRVE